MGKPRNSTAENLPCWCLKADDRCMVECSICKHYIHYECLGVNSIKELSSLINDQPGNYVCKMCLPKLTLTIESELKQHSQHDKVWMYELFQQPAAAAPVTGMEPGVITEIVKRVLEQLLPTMSNLIQDNTKEMLEKETKKKNLVIVGAKEGTDSIIHDRKICEFVCEKVGISNSAIVDVFRHGAVTTDGRPRILKLKFNDLSSRRQFLQGFQNVRRELSSIGRAWARPDLTFREREADRKLRQELEHMKANGDDVIIKGGKIIAKPSRPYRPLN